MRLFERGSLHLGVLWGIPVKVHWTFGYILLWILYSSHNEGIGVKGALWFGLFIMILFACVVLHEYGHALTARKFGIHTEDIILTPLGGIARLAKMPDKPWQELLVAIAGPLVNVAIALSLLLYIYFFPQFGIKNWDGDVYKLYTDKTKFPVAVLSVNVALVLFNLLPIFPMDGGRVLRALLSMKLKKVKATLIAMRVGQLLAIGMVIFGFYNGSITLSLIGVFIFYSAYMEYRYTKAEGFFINHSIKDVINPSLAILESTDLITNAREFIRFTQQLIFPVSEKHTVTGSLRATDFEDSSLDPYNPVSTMSLRQVWTASPNTKLTDVFKYFSNNEGDLIVINNDNATPSLIDKISFYNFLEANGMIRSSNS